MIRRARHFLARVRHAPARLDATDARLTDLAAAVQSDAVTARQHTDAAFAAARAAAQLHAEELAAQTMDHVDRAMAVMRRELTVARRVDIATNSSRAPAPPSQIDEALYVALEDRFRGDPALISERQRAYLPLVVGVCDAEHPVIDLGCGRGEWLRLLADANVPAIGVDSNAAFAEEVGEAGLTATHSDLMEYLRAAATGSAGAITLFHVIEHVPFRALVDLVAECTRVLRSGGVFIAETPNSLNLRVAASTFWIDPTHQRPLHPELLKFLAQQVGFAKVDGWFMNSLADPNSEVASDPVVRRLIELVDGPGDFALIAWT